MYIYNARIYTLDPSQPVVSALAMRDGRILGAGSDELIRQEFRSDGPGIDLKGVTVLPGLTDAHIHLEHYALGLQKVDCETESRTACLERVAGRAQRTLPGQWILGHGWNQNSWPEGFGAAADLDAVAPNHPVYLTAKSLHAAWANSAALRMAGINALTSDPPGGRLGRSQPGDGGAFGNPDGILFESAMELVARVVPEPTIEQVVEAIQASQPILWAMGITGAHDFDRRRCFAALQTLHQRGALGLRVLKSIPLEDLPHAAALGLRSGFGDDFLRIGAIKLFADGALGPQTAAMLQPYNGSPDNRGMLLLDAEEIFEHGRLAVDSGFALAVHAIGDQANHAVLDALSQLRAYERNRPGDTGRRLRHRIEHVQLIHPDDAGRLAELGVTASMQPIHATSDMMMADRYWGERAAFSYAWKLQLDNGATLAFGSDAPVESPNPFWGLHAAVTRRRPDGNPGPDGWYPQQRLTVEQAWKAFTTGAAYAAGWENRLGKLAPGYHADLIVLERDPFTVPPDELYGLRPSATMVAGNWVYQK